MPKYVDAGGGLHQAVWIDSTGGKAGALTPGEAAAMRRVQAAIRTAQTRESII